MEITIYLNDDQADTLRSGRDLDIKSVLMDLVMPEFESVDPIGQCQDCVGLGDVNTTPILASCGSLYM